MGLLFMCSQFGTTDLLTTDCDRSAQCSPNIGESAGNTLAALTAHKCSFCRLLQKYILVIELFCEP